jgi:hypothetical protein
MSVSYRYRVSVPLPAVKAAAPANEARSSVATHSVTGALAGSAAGVAAGLGAATLVPGVDVGVLAAMGVLFGGFNGALFALLRRLEGKQPPSRPPI